MALLIVSLLISNKIYAGVIWRIGIEGIPEGENDESDEFSDPEFDPNINMEILTYFIPQDWQERKNWESFPCRLWPQDVQFHPNEIHIYYDYPSEYRGVLLRLNARSAVKNYSQELVIIKGGDTDDTYTDQKSISLPSKFTSKPYEFVLGDIQKGVKEYNVIILKNHKKTENHSIIFDFIELVYPDLDEDGSLDSEENEGDFDGDGIIDKEDNDTATLIIQSEDNLSSKRITFDIQENESAPIFFNNIKFLNPSSPDLSPIPPDNLFFPFGFFYADILSIYSYDPIILEIMYPKDETIYHTAHFYFCINHSQWQSIPFDSIESNSIRIKIKDNTVWEKQQIDDQNNANMVTLIGGIAYLHENGIDIDEIKCFIKSLITCLQKIE